MRPDLATTRLDHDDNNNNYKESSWALDRMHQWTRYVAWHQQKQTSEDEDDVVVVVHRSWYDPAATQQLAIDACRAYQALPAGDWTVFIKGVTAAAGATEPVHHEHDHNSSSSSSTLATTEQQPRATSPSSSSTTTRAMGGRQAILYHLAVDCAPKSANALKAMVRQNKNSPALTVMDMAALHRACTPLHQHAIYALLQAVPADAMSFLVHARADLHRWMSLLRQQPRQSPNQRHEHCKDDMQLLLQHLQLFERSIFQWLEIMYSPGRLRVERIRYQTTPAGVLEQIVRNEAVHPMRGWHDLRQRLDRLDRRVFALFMPSRPAATNLSLDSSAEISYFSSPLQPLVVVYVALLEEIPSGMSQVLEQPRNQATSLPRVAAFYSISNLQPGLTGMGLGEALIKKAILCLQEEFCRTHMANNNNSSDTAASYNSTLDTFCTLSPLPGFISWLRHEAAFGSGDQLLTVEEQQSLTKILATARHNEVTDSPHLHAPNRLLQQLIHHLPFTNNHRLQGDDTNLMTSTTFSWHDHDALLGPMMKRLAAYYLLEMKQQSTQSAHRHHHPSSRPLKKPLDPVARFHFGNGATLHQIHYKADTTPKGWRTSGSVMVNYLYGITNNNHSGDNYGDNDRIMYGRFDQISQRQIDYHDVTIPLPRHPQVDALLSTISMSLIEQQPLHKDR